jgi:hypothetical protein
MSKDFPEYFAGIPTGRYNRRRPAVASHYASGDVDSPGIVEAQNYLWTKNRTLMGSQHWDPPHVQDSRTFNQTDDSTDDTNVLNLHSIRLGGKLKRPLIGISGGTAYEYELGIYGSNIWVRFDIYTYNPTRTKVTDHILSNSQNEPDWDISGYNIDASNIPVNNHLYAEIHTRKEDTSGAPAGNLFQIAMWEANPIFPADSVKSYIYQPSITGDPSLFIVRGDMDGLGISSEPSLVGTFPVDGQTSGTASASVALNAQTNVNSSLQATGNASGNVKGAVWMQGSVNGTGLTSNPSIIDNAFIQLNALGKGEGTTSVSAETTLSAEASSNSTVNASVLPADILNASAIGDGIASATLNGNRPVSGSVTGEGTFNASLSRQRNLLANALAEGTHTTHLSKTQPITLNTLTGKGTTSSVLSGLFPLDGMHAEGTGSASVKNEFIRHDYSEWLQSHLSDQNSSATAIWPADDTDSPTEEIVNGNDGTIASDNVTFDESPLVDDDRSSWTMDPANGTTNLYEEFPDATATDIGQSGENFTVFGWFNIPEEDNGDNWGTWLFNKGAINVELKNGNLSLEVQGYNSTNSYPLSTGTYLFVIVRDGSDFKLYIDGTRKETISVNGSANLSGTTSGVWNDYQSAFYPMPIGMDVHGIVRGTALTGSQIQQMYDAGINRVNTDDWFGASASSQGTASTSVDVKGTPVELTGSVTGSASSSAVTEPQTALTASSQGTGDSALKMEKDVFKDLSAGLKGTGSSSGIVRDRHFVYGDMTGTGNASSSVTLQQPYHKWLQSYLSDQSKPANAIWTSDETSGTTDGDIVNGHDGTLNGSPTLGANPVITDGNSFQFDGTDDYSQVPDSNDLDGGVSNPFTILTWVQFTQNELDNNFGVFFNKGGAINSDSLYILRTFGTDVRATVEDGSGNSANGVHSGTMQADTPHLVGLQLNSVGEVFAVLDDSREVVGYNSSLGSASNPNDLFFGMRGDGSGNIKGRFDVRLFTPHVLTDSEIQKIYNEGI